MPMTLTLLGTGTPAPLHHRAGSGYLIRSGDEAMLVDCGPGCVRRLVELGVSPARITSLFFTHLHYDHCVDYGYLVLTRWDQGAGLIPELTVYGPPHTARMTELLFGADGVFGPDLAARTTQPMSEFIYERRGGTLPRRRPAPRIIELGPGAEVDGASWTVRVAKMIHAEPQLLCLAYRFETADGSLVFGGDTAPNDRLTELARDADTLVHMCHFINGVVTDERLTSGCSGHLDAARTARDAGVRTLVLVHITEQLEKPGMRERILHEVGEVFRGTVVFGEDLMEVPLGALTPAGIQ